MEKNKRDSFRRMTPSMREAVAVEQEFAKKCQEAQPGLSDREFYELAREYWNEGAPAMAKSQSFLLEDSGFSIPFVIHYPTEKESLDTILYIHGGGFIVGSPKTHEGIMSRLARETGDAIVGIDYSLAPEAPFPQAILECAALACHLQKEGQRYGLSGNPVTLAGDSGGAYLSLATALHLRDAQSECRIRSLLLYYGPFGLEDSLSMRLYGGFWDGLTMETMKMYWQMFAPPEGIRTKGADLFSRDLTWGIPPAFIVGCDLDPLRDDSRLLHAILQEHGLVSVYSEAKGLIHGFLEFSKGVPEADKTYRESALFQNSLTDLNQTDSKPANPV